MRSAGRYPDSRTISRSSIWKTHNMALAMYITSGVDLVA